MTPTAIIAFLTKNKLPIPAELLPQTKTDAPKSRRRLKKHRVPNAIEGEFGHKLERDRQAGEIEDYIFEGVTLRWGDMEYTADYFVIRLSKVFIRPLTGPGVKSPNEAQEPGHLKTAKMIEAVYVEIKGGHKWEDSIIKFKAFRARMKWATFEMWGKEKGRWVRLA